MLSKNTKLLFAGRIIVTVFYLLQPPPWSLLHVNFDPQHMVERGQEVMTDIQGELLNGLYLNRCIKHKKQSGRLQIKPSQKSLSGRGNSVNQTDEWECERRAVERLCLLLNLFDQ